MYPHERSLVQRLANKPFVLLGVNSDSDRTELKEIMKRESITWRSWWDNGSVDGPIQTAWQITVRPTIHLIDHNGVIRYKDLTEQELDAAIDKLMSEASAASAPNSPPRPEIHTVPRG